MKKKIESLKVLTEERQKSMQRLNELEMLILEDAESIRQDVNAWKTTARTIQDLLVTKENGMMSKSVDFAVDGVVKNLLLRRTGWLTKFVISFLTKNYLKNFLAKNAETILEKVKKILAAATHEGKVLSE